MSDEQSFHDFVTRIRAGDDAAAAELVRRFEPQIRREVRMQLEQRGLIRLLDSTDVCQSVMASFFLRTAAGEYDLQSPGQLVGLLVKMVHNKLVSASRRHHRQRRDIRRQRSIDDADPDQLVDPSPGPDEQASHRELLVQVKQRLSPDELQIAKLRSDGAEWTEVASALGGTAQARRMQFSRTIDRIMAELEIAE